MLRILAYICFMFVAFELGNSQGWRGIVPLHSSCQDAQRALGITECEDKSYELEDATVSMTFSDGTCSAGWKVMAGTVLSLDVRPKPALRLADLRIDERKYRKVADQHDPNIVYYKNDHEGLTIVVQSNGMVAFLSYGPSLKDEYLSCPREPLEQEQSGGDPIFKFDEYGPIPAKEEQARLDQFAQQLRVQPGGKAYIIAYGGRRTWQGEAIDRATCTMDYLVKNQGIDKRRLVTVDGGYQEEALVSLFIGVENGAPPIATPTVDRSKVRITKHRPKPLCSACRAGNKRQGHWSCGATSN